MRVATIKTLTTIKNACSLGKTSVRLCFHKGCLELLKILYQEGFIQSFSVNRTTLEVLISLRTFQNESLLRNLKFISTPSHEHFIPFSSLSKVHVKNAFILLSTNKGFLTLSECKRQQVGGKLLFMIS